MVSPAVVGTGSTNKVSGTAQTKASAKKSGDFKSVMADSLANGATNGNIGKTNIKDTLLMFRILTLIRYLQRIIHQKIRAVLQVQLRMLIHLIYQMLIPRQIIKMSQIQ